MQLWLRYDSSCAYMYMYIHTYNVYSIYKEELCSIYELLLSKKERNNFEFSTKVFYKLFYYVSIMAITELVEVIPLL